MSATQYTSKSLEKILSAVDYYDETREGFRAPCPAHDGKSKDSLAITVGDDGRVLLHCFGGCSTDAICEALGITPSDLFDSDNAAPPTRPRPSTKTPKVYSDPDDAIKVLARAFDDRFPDASWEYHNSDGEHVATVLRWDVEGDKQIRQISRNGVGWTCQGHAEPRPLYRLPEVIAREHVFIVEGEKCADALRILELTATTSMGGSNAPGKTDWKPLSGKMVCLIPDHGKAGAKYADAVVDHLAELEPPPTLRQIRLPLERDNEDVADWLERLDAVEPADIRQQLKAMAEPIALELDDQPPLEFVPFPCDLLPEVLRDVVTYTAREMVCDPVYVALPALVACAAAIGSTRRLRVKQNWFVPAVLWAATVGKSGTTKTAPAYHAVRHLLARDRDMRDEEQRCAAGDVTIESLAKILGDNPRGLLVYRDELNGWLTSFQRYSRGESSGASMSGWLELYRGSMPPIDRKWDKTRVPSTFAAVSIVGTIQPEVLRATLSSAHWESGLAARLLLAMPPSKPKVWTDFEANQAIGQRYDDLIDELLTLTMSDTGKPAIVTLSDGARALYRTFYNSNAIETHEAPSRLAAAFSKLEEMPLRLSLVLHCVEVADAKNQMRHTDDLFTVQPETMERAIVLAEWFKHETSRVYQEFERNQIQSEEDDLVEWIRQHGGETTVRNVKRNYRPCGKMPSSEIELTLRKLCESRAEGRKVIYRLK